jgi:predicted nucleic acid-binding protein
MWGNILAQSELKGKPLPVIDAMIAATALVNHMAVATRNITDMTVPGLMIINPWNSFVES